MAKPIELIGQNKMGSQKPLSVDPNQISDFYNSVYYRNALPNTKIPYHFSRLSSKINIQAGQQVLDVACGKGEWLLAVNKLGAEPAGIDISHKAIDICKIILPHGEFYIGPAENLPFKDKRFHVVTCLGALEHFLDPKKALNEMVRTAKDDAIFLLLVPNENFLTRRLGFFRGTAQADVREEWRTLEEWQELFESAGLEVKKRWKDLHVLSWSWIAAKRWQHIPLRAIQAIALLFWPLSWQYQVYHLCRKKPKSI
jgi:SAM-dependent methyltransferase